MLWSLWYSAACQCGTTLPAYQSGERLTYEVAYNWGVVWVDAGKVTFKTDTVCEAGMQSYYFDSYGESYRFYDWIYKVRDRFQAVVEVDSFRPVWFSRNTSEGGYEVHNHYEYRWDQSRVISKTENSNKAPSIDTLAIEPCTFDVLSAIYFARNLSFEGLEVGDKLPIKFIIDGEFYELYIRYLGREIKKNRNGRAYDCVKFSAMLVEGTIFRGGEDMIVWISADENKVPVMVEAKILIGSIKAYLIGHENTLRELKVVEPSR